MIDFIDRVTDSSGTIITTGTPINRSNLMAVQGFENCNVVQKSDGSIEETYADGSKKTTTFNSDGSITEVFTGTKTITKTTTFAKNSHNEITINEVIS